MSLRSKLRKGMYITLAVSCIGLGRMGCHYYTNTHPEEIKQSTVEKANEHPSFTHGSFIVRPERVTYYPESESYPYYIVKFRESSEESGSLEWLEHREKHGLEFLVKEKIPMSTFGTIDEVNLSYKTSVEGPMAEHSVPTEEKLTGERKEKIGEYVKSVLPKLAEKRTKRAYEKIGYTGERDLSELVVEPK